MTAGMSVCLSVFPLVACLHIFFLVGQSACLSVSISDCLPVCLSTCQTSYMTVSCVAGYRPMGIPIFVVFLILMGSNTGNVGPEKGISWLNRPILRE